jgi:hypothetical protein
MPKTGNVVAVLARAAAADVPAGELSFRNLVRPEQTAEPGAPAGPPDKSRYNLFNPTPRELMPDMATDRPDKTESAYTVDAGHFQIEADLLSYSRDHDTDDGADVRTESWAVMTSNLKIGLTNDIDLQLVVESWNALRVDDREAGTVEHRNGFGDLAPRLKVNLWGNDGGPTAMSVMPFLKLPTNQNGLGNDRVEGGIIFPFAAELPRGWGLGAQIQVDVVRDGDDEGYHAEFSQTFAIGRDLVGNLGFYVELFNNVSGESGAGGVATLDFGFTLALTPDVQLDAGMNIGITRAAEDLNPFVGFSVRF